jgi:hypothetical protein
METAKVETKMETQVMTDAFIYERPEIRVRKVYKIKGTWGEKRLDHSVIMIYFSNGEISIYLHGTTVEEFAKDLKDAIQNAIVDEWHDTEQ